MEVKQVAEAIQEMLLDKDIKDKIKAQPPVPDPVTEVLTEPQILFLGTVSMKPSVYRGASSIYVFSGNSAVMMDCAEGSYGQMFDHFGSKDKVDKILLKTRVIFITHIHGDHQLGVLKVMFERDKLQQDLPQDKRTKLYIVTPTPMMKWMEEFRQDSLKHPELVELVPSNTLNPEKSYYYQKFIWHQVKPEYDRPHADLCEP